MRSKRVVVGLDPNGGEQLVYQVPADRTFIVRHVQVRIAGTGTFYLYPQGPAPSPIWVTGTAGGGVANTFETPPNWWAVLEEGDYLNLFGDATLTNATVWLFGALLLGNPA